MLTAIAIPVFTTQLERSREATDKSNIRAAYAEAVADYLASGATKATKATVANIKQTVKGWITDDPYLYTRINGSEGSVKLPDLVSGGSCTVNVDANGNVTFS